MHPENQYTIVVEAYNPEWPLLFSQLGGTLRLGLGRIAQRIDHIGSTSVPGLDAKPIIDVQLSVLTLEPWDTYRVPLERLGYVFREDNPERTKRYFREAPGQRRTHIHVRRCGSWGEQFALLFRDYMRSHPDDAHHYAQLKYHLAHQYHHDRHAYTDAKEPFIWDIMRKANAWSQATGWEPGYTDQ